MKMPKGDYEYRAHKSPAAGQPFIIDPAFPGWVTAVSEQEVVIQFRAVPGNVIETPFGPGRIREEQDRYLVDIEAREGRLVRTGNRIGRIVKVDDKMILLDYRHPFGYETLMCDVTAVKVTHPGKINGGKGE